MTFLLRHSLQTSGWCRLHAPLTTINSFNLAQGKTRRYLNLTPWMLRPIYSGRMLSLMPWRYWRGMFLSPGPWFNIKMSSYQYRKPHCGDKTVVRSSYFQNGISYTGKTTSLYWDGPLVLASWNKNLNNLQLLGVEEWHKVQIPVYIS